MAFPTKPDVPFILRSGITCRRAYETCRRHAAGSLGNKLGLGGAPNRTLA